MRRILIARSAGFCFGVKRAISIANDTAGTEGDASSGELPIFSLGPIIHNPQAVEELEQKGVHVVQSVDEVPCGKVIVRSHGITRTDNDALVEKGVHIVDATCPFVNKAQEHARTLSREGYAVIVVGDANHPEVKSIVSYI
ncbi:MAG: 4-hydroxy-3-methylbut-2-enyl diphosphate reductase, partial [Deltaproteobacteria bacterium]|nr:4-hydroxy-3-methylbut-2-enyl diphosphate reductase [Deltaproteobacteria bacterium]